MSGKGTRKTVSPSIHKALKKTTVLFSVRRFLQIFGLYAKTIIARALGFALLDLQKYEDSRGGIQILLRWRHL